MITQSSQPVFKENIFLTCATQDYYNNELIVSKNTLIRMLSGEMKIVLPDRTCLVSKGDTVFFPRNEVAKVFKTQKNGRPYKSVAIYFTPEAMQSYFLKKDDYKAGPSPRPAIKVIDPHPLLDSLFNSLLPYFELGNDLPESLAEAKVFEAISIIEFVEKDLFAILGNVEEPGKIDLAEFMEKNFRYNLPIERLGYLTGRSTTTFKRDFKKAFNSTPQRWLTEKRLELARFQIVEQKKRPVDVYLEVGFENLSHFSYAFKKQFGKSPSALADE